MMEQLIEQFPLQIKEALELVTKIDLSPVDKPVHEIVIIGMGGSGIGGDFVQSLVQDDCKVPIIIVKGYNLPAFVDENTMTVVSSYSGNTEESLTAFFQAIKKNCRVICLSSGGKLQEEAKQHNMEFIAMPPGIPSPRACLGYSLVLQLGILQNLGFIGVSHIEALHVGSDLIKFEQDEIKQKAKTIAHQLINKTVIIYSVDRFEPVATRFRQQLNENSKVLCWHHTFPEMNHNELVGWADNNPFAVIFLRNKDDFKKNAQRMDICKKIIAEKANTFIELFSKGQSREEKMVYFIHLADWISYFLAEERQVNVDEVRVIDYLKAELEKNNII